LESEKGKAASYVASSMWIFFCQQILLKENLRERNHLF